MIPALRRGLGNPLVILDNRQAEAAPNACTVTSFKAFASAPWSNANLVKVYRESGGGGSYNDMHFSNGFTGGNGNANVFVNWLRLDFGKSILVQEVELKGLSARDSAGTASAVGMGYRILRGVAAAQEATIVTQNATGGWTQGLALTYSTGAIAVNQWLRYLDLQMCIGNNGSNSYFGIETLLDCFRVKGSR